MPHLFRSGLSINGILAAVFDLGGEDPDEGPERPVGASRRGERPDIELPPNVRRSLQRSMARHFNSMDDSAWRRGCSERQLFQALALPLTLALLGLEGGWLRRSDPDAAELVAGVLDLIKPG
ncbi:MAG: hypothetical protein GY884_19700, partial [Proteobacteria bacterium]|nr:hypothetical protein [Pseudomonadota bacterium]